MLHPLLPHTYLGNLPVLGVPDTRVKLPKWFPICCWPLLRAPHAFFWVSPKHILHYLLQQRSPLDKHLQSSQPWKDFFPSPSLCMNGLTGSRAPCWQLFSLTTLKILFYLSSGFFGWQLWQGVCLLWKNMLWGCHSFVIPFKNTSSLLRSIFGVPSLYQCL